MLKNVTKRVVAAALCAVLLFTCVVPAYATEDVSSTRMIMTSDPVFEAGARVVRIHRGIDYSGPMNVGSPMYYYVQNSLTNDSIDTNREFGEFAIFIDGKECKIDDDTFTLYPRIWYEFRTYFHNDSDKALDNVYYQMKAPDTVMWDSLPLEHLVPNDEGELSHGVLIGDQFFDYSSLPDEYTGGIAVDGVCLTPQNLALRYAKRVGYGNCGARMMYYWYRSEDNTTVESVRKKELAGGDNVSLGVIPPHTYGYVSSFIFCDYDSFFWSRINVWYDSISAVFQLGYTTWATT